MVGSYVYNTRDRNRKNLLVIEITKEALWVYCMRTNDKFWIEKRHVKRTPLPWEKRMNWIICDLDGTLFTAAEGEDWYDRNFLIDKVVPEVKELLKRFKDYGIIFLTGRKEIHQSQTIARLLNEDYDVLNDDKYKLFMRKDKDIRPDWEVKKEIYSLILKSYYNIAFVIEDRPRVVKMWRQQGLFVFEVNQRNEDF